MRISSLLSGWSSWHARYFARNDLSRSCFSSKRCDYRGTWGVSEGTADL